MTDGPGVVVCWNCARASTGTDACEWCGVWLAELDSGPVPPAARPLLGLARRWGTPDDGYRSEAIARASRAELEAVILALRDDDGYDEVQRWLIGPVADAARPRGITIEAHGSGGFSLDVSIINWPTS